MGFLSLFTRKMVFKMFILCVFRWMSKGRPPTCSQAKITSEPTMDMDQIFSKEQS
jgi:hypothetical protein